MFFQIPNFIRLTQQDLLLLHGRSCRDASSHSIIENHVDILQCDTTIANPIGYGSASTAPSRYPSADNGQTAQHTCYTREIYGLHLSVMEVPIPAATFCIHPFIPILLELSIKAKTKLNANCGTECQGQDSDLRAGVSINLVIISAMHCCYVIGG